MSDFIPVWTALGAGISQGEKENNEKKAKAAGEDSPQTEGADKADA